MQLSKRCEYALRALIDIGIAQETGRPLLRSRELARHESISPKFLEQILVQLRDAGILASKRGKDGGYHLAQPMADIVMGRVIRLIDGRLAPIGCVSVGAYEPCTCPDEDHCGLRMLMLDVHEATTAIVDRYTLADIVGISLRKLRRDRIDIPFRLRRSVEKETTDETRLDAPRRARARRRVRQK